MAALCLAEGTALLFFFFFFIFIYSLLPFGGFDICFIHVKILFQEAQTCLKLKSGSRKWSAGYQPELCCLLTCIDNEPPPPITSLSFNSKYGLLVYTGFHREI